MAWRGSRGQKDDIDPDVLARRRIARHQQFGRRGDPGEDVLTAAADVAGAELDWTPDRRAAELDAARTAVRLPD